MKKKSFISLLMATMMATTLFAGCGSSGENGDTSSNNDAKSEGNVKITYATYEDEASKFDKIGVLDKFKEKYPNIDVEIETFKDSDEMDKSLKVRAAANELPDVMFLKTQQLSDYSSYVVDETDWDIVKDNEYASEFTVDGKTVGVPLISNGCYTYYWKDQFEEAGVEVPTTWPEFVDVVNKLQEYYGEKDPTYVALAVGAKDEWATYPYMQYGGLCEGQGDSNIWNTMAATDEPFTKGTDVYNAYKKVYDLFSSGVCGADPLGTGHDQMATLFGAKKCGMISITSVLPGKLADSGVDISEMGSFFLPRRNTENDPYNVNVNVDEFLAVSNDASDVDACRKFIEFLFSDEVYGDILSSDNMMPSKKGVEAQLDPVIQEASDTAKANNAVFVVEKAPGADYTSIANDMQFNYNKIGTEFFVDGFDFDKEMENLNEQWSASRKKLNIQ